VAVRKGFSGRRRKSPESFGDNETALVDGGAPELEKTVRKSESSGGWWRPPRGKEGPETEFERVPGGVASSKKNVGKFPVGKEGVTRPPDPKTFRRALGRQEGDHQHARPGVESSRLLGKAPRPYGREIQSHDSCKRTIGDRGSRSAGGGSGPRRGRHTESRFVAGKEETRSPCRATRSRS